MGVTMPNKDIQGIQIFRSGEQIDSRGNKRTWNAADLDKMIDNFNKQLPEVVPIKFGHSSPEHTAKVAEELGLTPAILAGEEGKGAATLGKVTKLSRYGDTIIANVNAPDKVAGMIKAGYLTGVSSEVFGDYKGNGPALSALAALGAERPAIKGMTGLTSLHTHADGIEPDFIYTSAIEIIEPNPEATKKADQINQAHLQVFSSMADKIYSFQAVTKTAKVVGKSNFHRHMTDKGKTAVHSHKGGLVGHTHPGKPKYLGPARSFKLNIGPKKRNPLQKIKDRAGNLLNRPGHSKYSEKVDKLNARI